MIHRNPKDKPRKGEPYYDVRRESWLRHHRRECVEIGGRDSCYPLAQRLRARLWLRLDFFRDPNANWLARNSRDGERLF